jgi:hypothetical protein
MTRPRRPVRTDRPKRKRERNTLPADTWVRELLRMREEEPGKFEKSEEHQKRLVENWEMRTKTRGSD